MADIADIKAKYPQYSDMSDDDFADKFYNKYYKDMPRDEFDKKLNVAPKESLLTNLAGHVESTLSNVTGMVGGMAGGLNYLGTLAATGGNLDAAKSVQEDTANALTYQPRTKSGKERAQILPDAFEKLGKQVAETQGKTISDFGLGTPDPEVMKAAADAYLNVAPIHELGGILKRKGVVEPKVTPENELPPPRVPDEPKAPVQAPETPENGFPPLDMSEVSPIAPEAPVEPPTGLPELHDPSPEGTLPEGPQAPPEMAVQREGDPLPPPRPETPLPELQPHDNPLLDLQDKPTDPEPTQAVSANPETPLPTIDFPDRTTAFDSDPRLQAAQKYVQMEAGKVTPEARARVEAKKQEMIAMARDEYGIDENTVRKKLYESGNGTQGVIKKTYSQRGLGGARQNGSADINLLTGGVAGMIERITGNKFEANRLKKDVAKNSASKQQEVNNSLREQYKPLLNDAADLKQKYQRVVNTMYNRGIDPEFHSRVLKAMNPWNNEAIGARRMERVYEEFGGKQQVIDRIRQNANDAKLGENNLRSITGNKQSGSVDINLMTAGIGKLIERFKKKDVSVDPQTTPITKAQGEVVPKSLREYFKPINKASDVLKAIIDNREKDIPGYKKEGFNDAKRAFGSGIRIHAERTGNSLLMFTHTALFDHGEAPAKAAINKFINAKDGVGPLLKKLDKSEQIKAWKALKMEDKYNTRYNADQLKELGFGENVKPLLDAVHSMHDNIFSKGGKGDYRTGYTPHSWRGDYTAVVRDKANKKTLEVLGAKDAAEMDRAIKNAKERFPNADISDVNRKPLKSERSWNRGVLTIQDIMDVLKNDGHLSNEALSNIVNDRDITSTRKLFSGQVHDLNRASYEIRGWDGDKPWLNDADNASEGWKSLIGTAEQQYFHHYLQDPVNNIKSLLSNPEVVERQPNAVKAAEAYMKDKTGSNDIWATGRAINTVVDATAEVFGKGGSTPTNIKDGIRKFTHLWQLGINLKNFAVQLTQPVVSGLPYLKLMQKAEGMGAKEVTRGTTLGIARYIRSLTEEKLGQADQFTKDMTQYATDNGMRSFAETENAMDAANSKFVRTVDKIGNTLPGVAEKITRAPTFSIMASMLKEAWDRDPTKFANQEELFQTAKNYTQTIMVDYSQNPSAYKKMFGSLGSLAGQFKTYGFATTGALRLLYKHDKVAFATAVGMLTYVTGINGLPFYQDINNLVKDASGIFGDKLVDIEDLYKDHFPEIAKITGLSSDTLFHGGLSQQLGVNVEQQFGFSNTIPEVDFNKDTSPGMQIAENITPSMSGVITPLAKSVKGVFSTNKIDHLDAIKSILPNQLKGPFENAALTSPEGNVINPSTGQYQAHTRTPKEQMMRNFNLTSNQEINDKQLKFKADEQGHFLQQKEKAALDDIVKRTMADDVQPKDIEAAVQSYMKAGGDPNSFVNSYITKLGEAHTEGIARGAGVPKNSIASINRYLRYHPELTQGH